VNRYQQIRTDTYTGDWIQLAQQKMQWHNFGLHNSKYFSVV